MTLRPGDVVTLRGSAVDPNGRPVRWRISSPFRAGGQLTLWEGDASTFDMTWDVTEADIREQLEMDVHSISIVGPRRYGEFDDQVQLIYRALLSI